MKRLRTVGVFAILIVVVLGLLVAPSAAQSTSGGTITWGVSTDATGIDVQTNGQDVSRQLLSLVYERLVNLDDNLNVVPGLAESWDQVDPTTYVFHLRHGVKFSNGREMTADDVVASIKRVTDPKLGSYLISQIPLDSATKVDDYTVQVKLKSPSGAFLQGMALEAASIIPGKELADGSFDLTTDMLGTGPFMLKQHLPDESWTFVRNPYYWGSGLPKADSAVVKVIPDESAMLAGLRDGSIDIAVIDDFDALTSLAQESNIEADIQNLAQYYVLTLNSVNPQSPFLDEHVRQAINLAIDKQQIADLVFGGHAQIAVPAVSSAEACDTSKIPLAQYDPDQAKTLLQQANENGLSFNLLASPGPALAIAQVIQSQLQAVGLNPTIENPDEAEEIQRVYGGFTADKPGEGVADISFNGTGASAIFGYSNWAASWMSGVSNLVSDPTYTADYAKAVPMSAGSDRTALFQDMCSQIYTNASHLPLVTKGHIVAFRKDLITVIIQPTEVSSDFLRNIAQFTVLNPQ